MHQARTWLGTDGQGRPHVALVHEDGYRLHPGVDVDVHRFRQLLGTDPTVAPTASLTRALQLVRGQPISGINPARYIWTDLDRQELINSIGDTASELATRALAAGRPRAASWASAIAVTVEPSSEPLWRLRLQAAAATGDPTQLNAAAAGLRSRLGSSRVP